MKVEFVSNSVMEYPHDIEQRLIDLEIKASFSEDMVDQLNQVIVRQQQQIDLLMREISQLRQQIPEAGSGVAGRSGEDLPPHY
jgi:SlyX protein